jgi:hypothetical protein
MNGRCSSSSAIVVLALAVAASLAGASVASAGTSGEGPAWLAALEARSYALNDRFAAPHHPRAPLGSPSEGWKDALLARGDALNRAYGLGRYADATRTTAETMPDWLVALTVRSDGFNRMYRLGAYAVMPASAGQPAWLTALIARSAALNERFGLGR